MSERLGAAELTTPRPEFNGGAFTISRFSPSPEGFNVVTRNTIRRRPDRTKRFILEGDARSRLTAAMKGELEFNMVQTVSDARTILKTAINAALEEERLVLPEEQGYKSADLYPNNLPKEERERRGNLRRFIVETRRDADFLSTVPEDVREAYGVFETIRTKCRQKGKKLGLRNIGVEGNGITADVKLVSFPVYNQFARPEDSAALRDLSVNAAAAMIVRSKDGRLVIQHRAVAKQRLTEPKLSRGNAQFTDVPGASAAGMLDASLRGATREPGEPDPIDTTSVSNSILKEAGEELGLEPDDLTKIRIVGLAHDKIKLHDEFLLLADTNLTAEEIKRKSRESTRNKGLGDADFEEKFIDIDGSVDSIETLLTKVKCPLPPTHAAALVAAGYSLVLQEKGRLAADTWRIRLRREVQENYRDIDQRVKTFYDQHPEALKQVPERFWDKKTPARRLQGYDPAYAPDEQGLPSFEDAMVEAGLMPETRRRVDAAWLFDVDGVIADPTSKTVPEKVLAELVSMLQRGEPVCLNTGRSSQWIEERVINPLKTKITDNRILDNLVIIAEFGATWDTFDDKGALHHGRVSSLEVPQVLRDRIQALVEDEYGEAVMFDTSKETHVTLEMKDGHDLQSFRMQQVRLVDIFQQILADTGNEDKYVVHADTIATNIKSPYVTKALGVARFIEFLRDKGIKPAKFEAFGDSPTDLEMLDELLRRNEDAKLVFVGDLDKLAEARIKGQVKDPSRVVSVGGYTQGTMSYFER